MKKNDDIVGQRIVSIRRDGLATEIVLSNGMGIRVNATQVVDDAGALYPISRWVTVRDGERVRSPETNQTGDKK